MSSSPVTVIPLTSFPPLYPHAVPLLPLECSHPGSNCIQGVFPAVPISYAATPAVPIDSSKVNPRKRPLVAEELELMSDYLRRRSLEGERAIRKETEVYFEKRVESCRAAVQASRDRLAALDREIAAYESSDSLDGDLDQWLSAEPCSSDDSDGDVSPTEKKRKRFVDVVDEMDLSEETDDWSDWVEPDEPTGLSLEEYARHGDFCSAFCEGVCRGACGVDRCRRSGVTRVR